MKNGTRVKIGDNAHFSGMRGTVRDPSWKTDRGQCYNVELDNGEIRSFLYTYLIELVEVEESQVVKEMDYITLDQVIQAKRAVDKAQRDWIELLSAYQLQEASKK